MPSASSGLAQLHFPPRPPACRAFATVPPTNLISAQNLGFSPPPVADGRCATHAWTCGPWLMRLVLKRLFAGQDGPVVSPNVCQLPPLPFSICQPNTTTSVDRPRQYFCDWLSPPTASELVVVLPLSLTPIYCLNRTSSTSYVDLAP